MAIEKSWGSVPAQPITSNGTSDGHITVPDATLFFVKQEVNIFSNTVSPLILEIKKINSYNDIELGPKGSVKRSNLTSIVTGDSPKISAEEQPRPAISTEDVLRASYANEPAVGLRTLPIDKLGNPIDTVKGSDSKNRLAVDAEVNVEVNSIALFTKPYDAIVSSYPSGTQEQYQSKIGGISGTNVQLVTVNYTDASKNLIANAFRIDN